MTILITGAGGFAGSHMVDYLLPRINSKQRIVGMDSFRHEGHISRLDHVKDKITIINHDLTIPITHHMRKHLDDCEYILHFASLSHVDTSISDPVMAWQNNTMLQIQILEFARTQQNLRLFVQVSTDEVYGATSVNRPAKEWDAIIPSNPYSASKAAQEALCSSYFRTYDIPVCIVNLMNLIGERQSCDKYIPKIMRCVRNKIPVLVHGSPSGKAFGGRHYQHVQNVCSAIYFLMEKASPFPPLYSAKTDRPWRYNVTGEREVDNLAMAQMVADLMQKPLDYRIGDWHSTRPGHDPTYALDGSLIRSEGWKQEVFLDEAVRRTVQWFMDNPDWLR